MKNKEFYEYVNNYVIKLSNLYNIDDNELKRYYELTDFEYLGIKEEERKGINSVFIQFAFHAQNATLISNIIKFKEKFDFLKEVFCGFDPNKFLNGYEKEKEEIFVENYVDKLRYGENNQCGLEWNIDKSDNPDYIVKRYINSLIDGALLLKDYNSREELINAFKEKYDELGYQEFICKYFLGKVKTGFSVALACDFLKELDIYFDLPKPDIHLLNTLGMYKNKEYKVNRKNDQLQGIEDLKGIVKELKEQGIDISCYKLDRMIWLCCTENFFLHGINRTKKFFLSGIR